MEDAKRRKLNAEATDTAAETAVATTTATPNKEGDTVEDPDQGSTVDDVIAAVSEAAAAEAAKEDEAGNNPHSSPQVAKKDGSPADATRKEGDEEKTPVKSPTNSAPPHGSNHHDSEQPLAAENPSSNSEVNANNQAPAGHPPHMAPPHSPYGHGYPYPPYYPPPPGVSPGGGAYPPPPYWGQGGSPPPPPPGYYPYPPPGYYPYPPPPYAYPGYPPPPHYHHPPDPSGSSSPGGRPSASAGGTGPSDHHDRHYSHHNQSSPRHQTQSQPQPQPQRDYQQLTGRPPAILYMSCDNDSLSAYQCLVRRQIEVFEALFEDVESNAQGRNKPIVIGQVGIRCRHCCSAATRHRARASVYFPAKLLGMYQAAQNMATIHLCKHCQLIPQGVRSELLALRERKSSAGGGKKYWADGAKVLGIYEAEDGLRFEKR